MSAYLKSIGLETFVRDAVQINPMLKGTCLEEIPSNL